MIPYSEYIKSKNKINESYNCVDSVYTIEQPYHKTIKIQDEAANLIDEIVNYIVSQKVPYVTFSVEHPLYFMSVVSDSIAENGDLCDNKLYINDTPYANDGYELSLDIYDFSDIKYTLTVGFGQGNMGQVKISKE